MFFSLLGLKAQKGLVEVLQPITSEHNFAVSTKIGLETIEQYSICMELRNS